MIEVCLVLMIISLLTLIPFKHIKVTTEVKETMDDLISTQYRAFETHQKQKLDLSEYNQAITYNANGNISQAMRIDLFNKQQITIMLATGRIFMHRFESD